MNQEDESIKDSKDLSKSSKDLDPDIWSGLVVDGVKYLFKNVWSFTSSLVGFIGILYLVGWVTSFGYFSKFGSSWLTNSQSLIQIIEFSKIPLIWFFIILAGVVVDFFDFIHIPKQLFFFKHYFKFFWIVLGIILIEELIDSYFYPLPKEAKQTVTLISAFYFLNIVIQSLKYIVFLKIEKSKVVEESMIRLIIIFGWFGCFLYPYSVGTFMAQTDADWNRSSIPRVKTKSTSGNHELRFLFKSETHVYTAEFVKSGPPYKIRILPIDKIEYIEPYQKNIKKDQDSS